MTMIKSDLRGKKLLLIGGLNTTADLIKLAHRNGVKIGVADYNKNTYVKGLADYAHDISVVDENSVIELFKRENYDGIITAFNEMLGPYTSRIAEKLEKPFPFTVEHFLNKLVWNMEFRFLKNMQLLLLMKFIMRR